MGHLSGDNAKLIARVRRLRGQLEGVERMLSEGDECYAVLQNASACRGAFNSLMREMILSHIDHHLVENDEASGEIRTTAKEIQEIIKSFLK